jgi:hypothetical protein
MSLAIYAAPFDGESNNDNNNTNQRKKGTHNRTQKNTSHHSIHSDKVNNVLQTIHNTLNGESDGNSLGDYYANPPPKPKSVGAERASTKENFQNNTMNNTLGSQAIPAPSEINQDLELNQFQSNYLDNLNANEYYKKFIPNYNPAMIPPKMQNGYPYPTTATPYYAATGIQNPVQQQQSYNRTSGSGSGSNDVLLNKLNYMINLLEEKQDEKTNNVTEEVVLYSFLGIFIIFVVDSFTRVGRYTR